MHNINNKPIANKEVPKLRFQIFSVNDYETYKFWFQDHRIKKALYDIDEAWLDFVLNDESGIEYAVFENEEMKAVVGIELPTLEDPFYAIKNIAVNP